MSTNFQSDIVDQITAVLRGHMFYAKTNVCTCGWLGDADDWAAHVAERVVAELGMTAVRCADERWWSTRIERGVY